MVRLKFKVFAGNAREEEGKQREHDFTRAEAGGGQLIGSETFSTPCQK